MYKKLVLFFTILFFSTLSLFAAGKLLSSNEYRKILMQSGSDYFPSKVDGEEIHSFDIKVLGEVNSSAGHIAVLRSDVIWGTSERCTSRIVFFLNGKPYGHFYELQPHETFELNGNILIAGRNSYNLKNGIPNKVMIYNDPSGEYNLERF